MWYVRVYLNSVLSLGAKTQGCGKVSRRHYRCTQPRESRSSFSLSLFLSLFLSRARARSDKIILFSCREINAYTPSSIPSKYKGAPHRREQWWFIPSEGHAFRKAKIRNATSSFSLPSLPVYRLRCSRDVSTLGSKFPNAIQISFYPYYSSNVKPFKNLIL